MDGANYLGEGYKLYEVNFKGLFSSTTPQFYNPYNGFSLVERAFIGNLFITDC